MKVWKLSRSAFAARIASPWRAPRCANQPYDPSRHSVRMKMSRLIATRRPSARASASAVHESGGRPRGRSHHRIAMPSAKPQASAAAVAAPMPATPQPKRYTNTSTATMFTTLMKTCVTSASRTRWQPSRKPSTT
ncbi:hypothetical protein B0G84_3542 [Paraburkholderia sp. BL8N3]|nr:hypothetical protein B0G84_3542 [Paraburkholderia sp. BL8N3]